MDVCLCVRYRLKKYRTDFVTVCVIRYNDSRRRFNTKYAAYLVLITSDDRAGRL